MNPVTITLTQAQANLIFHSLQTHVARTQDAANQLIQYIDAEFVKANPISKENEVEQPNG